MRHDGEFERFVAATATRMLRSATLLCGDPHLAEDLTQTTYAKVHAKWRRVSRADDPVAYARTMLIRTFLDHRRLRRSGELPSAELPEQPSSQPDAEVRLDLLRALGQLTSQDRAVLVLRYWEDLSISETARLLNITEVACRSRTSRALARLRTQLPELDPSINTQD